MILRCLWGLEAYIYIYIYKMLMSSVDQCILILYNRATGGYICGCGRPSNLVIMILCNTYIIIKTVVAIVHMGLYTSDIGWGR